MMISVVIPAYNEEKLLESTLMAVREASQAWHTRGWTSECIVCDNNSTDRTSEIARNQGARVVFEPFNQIGRARNTGAAAATGDWIVFVDADSLPTSELFAAAGEAIASGKVLAGGSTLRLEADAWDVRLMIRLWNHLSRFMGWMAGSFIFVEADAFRRIGGFSPGIFAGEELDLTHRLKIVARAERKKVVILRSAPLLTSARKLELYSRTEIFSFLLRFITRRKSTQANRDACAVWYDGRR